MHDLWMGNRGEIAKLAARQGGFITRDQLVDVGLPTSTIGYRVKTGELTLVCNGVYQVFPPEDHVGLIRGAVLALPEAVASHESAAHLLALPRLPALVPTVTVPSHTTHRFSDVFVRRNDDVDPAHVTKVDRVRVTTVARTVFDLAGILEFKEFEAIAEAAILNGRMTLRHLESMIGQLARRGKPGTQAARDFVVMRSDRDPRATKLETLGRKVLSEGGLPQPLSQYPMPWDSRRRFDDAYPEARLAIEWDSRAWHSQRERMTADRRRDREAATFGWLVVRFTWEDLKQGRREVVGTVSSLLKERGNPKQS